MLKLYFSVPDDAHRFAILVRIIDFWGAYRRYFQSTKLIENVKSNILLTVGILSYILREDKSESPSMRELPSSKKKNVWFKKQLLSGVFLKPYEQKMILYITLYSLTDLVPIWPLIMDD